MGLYIRMALYLVSGWAAGMGWANFDEAAGTVAFNLDEMAVVIGGLITFVATFVASRFAKIR